MSPDLIRKALEEKARRQLLIRALLGPQELFAQQRQVALHPGRFKALCCGRRAGKTELLARLIVIALLESGANEWVNFGAKTQKRAKEIIWHSLRKIIREHGLESSWRINDLQGSIVTPTGAQFTIVGFDNTNTIEELRGGKKRLFICDEVSTYDEHLELIKKVVVPSLGDVRGTMIVSGTPGYAKAGPWWRICAGAEPGWHVFPRWTVRDNAFFQDPEGWLAEERKTWGYAETTPAYLREYMGQWVNDDTMLVYPQYLTVPEGEVELDYRRCVCTVSMDYGIKDATAWVVLAQPRGSEITYVVHSHKESGLLNDQIAKMTAELVERFEPVNVVGDTGGGGSSAIEEFNRRWAGRFGVYIRPASKHGANHSKRTMINMLDTDLRKGTLKILDVEETRALRDELDTLVWKNDLRNDPHPGYEDHACDALRYAHHHHFGLGESLDEGPRHRGVRSAMTSDDAHRQMLEDMEFMRQRQDEHDLYGP